MELSSLLRRLCLAPLGVGVGGVGVGTILGIKLTRSNFLTNTFTLFRHTTGTCGLDTCIGVFIGDEGWCCSVLVVVGGLAGGVDFIDDLGRGDKEGGGEDAMTG